MNTVRCKFVCYERAERYDSYNRMTVYSYRFNAVISGSEENQQFWRWTPGGQLTVDAVKQNLFEPGKEYYLDLSPSVEEAK